VSRFRTLGSRSGAGSTRYNLVSRSHIILAKVLTGIVHIMVVSDVSNCGTKPPSELSPSCRDEGRVDGCSYKPMLEEVEISPGYLLCVRSVAVDGGAL
jgi:hypothetical protein